MPAHSPARREQATTSWPSETAKGPSANGSMASSRPSVSRHQAVAAETTSLSARAESGVSDAASRTRFINRLSTAAVRATAASTTTAMRASRASEVCSTATTALKAAPARTPTRRTEASMLPFAVKESRAAAASCRGWAPPCMKALWSIPD